LGVTDVEEAVVGLTVVADGFVPGAVVVDELQADNIRAASKTRAKLK